MFEDLEAYDPDFAPERDHEIEQLCRDLVPQLGHFDKLTHLAGAPHTFHHKHR